MDNLVYQHGTVISRTVSRMDSPNLEEVGSWDNLAPELALKDSPLFRASLQNVEDEVETAARWLESFIKNIREALLISTSSSTTLDLL